MSGKIDFLSMGGVTLYPVTLVEGIYNLNGEKLQTLLDAKQPKGSYALTSHNHDTVYSKISHTHESLFLTDSRDVNNLPNDKNLARKLSVDFKYASKVALSSAVTYAPVISLYNWTDSSGGNAFQFGCVGDTNIPRLYTRTAPLGNTSWGSWYEIYSSARKPSCADIGAFPAANGSFSRNYYNYHSSWNSAANHSEGLACTSTPPGNSFINLASLTCDSGDRMVFGWLNDKLVVGGYDKNNLTGTNNCKETVVLYNQAARTTELSILNTFTQYRFKGTNGQIAAVQSGTPNTGMLWAW